MKKYFSVHPLSFSLWKKSHHGYALFAVMLIIGVISLYLSYQLSLKNMNTQSWQLAKTTTEFSYWFDIEQNYEQDYSLSGNSAALNNMQLTTLIQNHYLPYGMARTPSFASSSTPKVLAVSEFQCSPLPGINPTDDLLNTTSDNTCPLQTSGVPGPLCALNEPAYYSCATNTVATMNQAQYYINANHIALGYDAANSLGLGLIIRTPGVTSSYVNLGQSGSRALLPNGSFAQSLISVLPSSAFNLYSTNTVGVNGIGIGSYLGSNGSTSSSGTLQPNTRYSKIIDMGVVQVVDPTKSTLSCYGWDSNGNKTGVNGSYTGSGSSPTGGSDDWNNSFPPTCIRIDTTKYGPTGSVEKCTRLDLFYTMYRNYLGDSNYDDTNSTRFYSSTSSKIVPNGNYLDVYVAQSLQMVSPISPYRYTYTSNGSTPGKDSDPEQYTWLVYFLRCTRTNA